MVPPFPCTIRICMLGLPAAEHLDSERARLRAEVQRETAQQQEAAAAKSRAERAKAAWTAHRSEEGQVRPWRACLSPSRCGSGCVVEGSRLLLTRAIEEET